MIFSLLTDVWHCTQSVTWECASSTFALISLFHCFFARCPFFFKGQHSPAVSWKGNLHFASNLLLKVQSVVLSQNRAPRLFTVFYSATRPYNWGLHHCEVDQTSERGRFLCLILFWCWSIILTGHIWCFSCRHRYQPFPRNCNMRHLISSSWSSVSVMSDSHIDQTTSLFHE